MKIAIAVSLALHGVALGAMLADWRLPGSVPQEVPGKIEVIFGRTADSPGSHAEAPPAPAPTPPPAPVLPVAPSRSGDTPASLVARQVPPAPAAPSADPVRRPGDGAAGFLRQPDPALVEAPADPGNRPPRYPDGARARGEHGTVVLRIHITPEGGVSGIETLRTSGSAELDEAARLAALRWHFIPQMRDGVPAASSRDQAMSFVLE